MGHVTNPGPGRCRRPVFTLYHLQNVLLAFQPPQASTCPQLQTTGTVLEAPWSHTSHSNIAGNLSFRWPSLLKLSVDVGEDNPASTRMEETLEKEMITMAWAGSQKLSGKRWVRPQMPGCHSKTSSDKGRESVEFTAAGWGEEGVLHFPGKKQV